MDICIIQYNAIQLLILLINQDIEGDVMDSLYLILIKI